MNKYYSNVGSAENELVEFIAGLAMLVVGGYMFMNSVIVGTTYGLGYFHFGSWNFNMPSGVVFVPLIIGVVMLFYKPNIVAKIVCFFRRSYHCCGNNYEPKS